MWLLLFLTLVEVDVLWFMLCEFECLYWMMEGKIVWEVGVIFSIIECIVVLYINNVMYKFGCMNKY